MRRLCRRWLLACAPISLWLAGCQGHQASFATDRITRATIGIDAAEAHEAVVASLDRPPPPPPRLADPREWDQAPETSQWQLGLEEALALALENSTIVRAVAQDAIARNSSSVRAAPTTAFDSEIAHTDVEAELGQFDVRLESSLLGEEEENPPQTSVDGVVRRATELDRARLYTGVSKRLPAGGGIAAGLDTGYRYTPPAVGQSLLNPQYQPRLGIELRQPLLRGRGTEVNLTPVIIAAARSEQTAWEFHEAVLSLLRSVESTYWSLYEAQTSVDAIDRVLPLLEEAVRLADAHVRADVAIPASLAQAKAELLDFQRERLAALAAVRQNEAVLRNLMGLKPEAAMRIAVDAPFVPHEPELDWQQIVDAAMIHRPDIIQQRLTVYVARQTIAIARNNTLASVDALATWRAKGLSANLYDAVDVLNDFRYNDWTVGLSFEYPLGNRTPKSRLRAAELVLQRERERLEQVILSASHELSDVVYDVHTFYKQYELAAQRRGEILEWMHGARARYMHPTPETSLSDALDIYLKAIRASAESEREAASLLVSYYRARARLHEATGVQLASYNLHLSDDPRDKVHRVLEPRPLPPVEATPKDELWDLSP